MEGRGGEGRGGEGRGGEGRGGEGRGGEGRRRRRRDGENSACSLELPQLETSAIQLTQ